MNIWIVQGITGNDFLCVECYGGTFSVSRFDIYCSQKISASANFKTYQNGHRNWILTDIPTVDKILAAEPPSMSDLALVRTLLMSIGALGSYGSLGFQLRGLALHINFRYYICVFHIGKRHQVHNVCAATL